MQDQVCMLSVGIARLRNSEELEGRKWTVKAGRSGEVEVHSDGRAQFLTLPAAVKTLHLSCYADDEKLEGRCSVPLDKDLCDGRWHGVELPVLDQSREVGKMQMKLCGSYHRADTKEETPQPAEIQQTDAVQMTVKDEDFIDVKRLLKVGEESLLGLKGRFVGRQIWNIEPQLSEEEAQSAGCSNTRSHVLIQAIMTGSDPS